MPGLNWKGAPTGWQRCSCLYWLQEIYSSIYCSTSCVHYMCAVLCLAGPAGPKPWDLVPLITCPLFVAWGDTDPFTPVDGPVAKYFLQMANSRPDTTFTLLQGVGHCPQAGSNSSGTPPAAHAYCSPASVYKSDPLSLMDWCPGEAAVLDSVIGILHSCVREHQQRHCF